MTPYLASLTRRWHANPYLCHTGDDLASHGGRMAILALMFWPEPDAVLLAQCVTHDLGEYKTGDIPWGAPNKDHEAEDIARGEMGMCFNPPDPRLKFLDSLDAYLWMQHHAQYP